MSGRFRRTYKRQGGGGEGNGDKGGGSRKFDKAASDATQRQLPNASKARERAEQNVREDAVDLEFGYDRFSEGPAKIGWMFNMRTTSFFDLDSQQEFSCLDLYFVEPDGKTFKARYRFEPYFLLRIKDNTASPQEIESFMFRKFENLVSSVTPEMKEDLDTRNHLSGLKTTYFKLSFRNVQDLMDVRRVLQPVIEKNKRALDTNEAYTLEDQSKQDRDSGGNGRNNRFDDLLDAMLDMREYDVPYIQRVCTDRGIRVGLWYTVTPQSDNSVKLTQIADKHDRPILHIMALDIETTKMPLKFPDSKIDAIMMISYMVDGKGYLIVNREVVAADVPDFEYTPKPEYEGPFSVFNEANELALLRRFYSECKRHRPQIYVTYNGDFFDWPFIADRTTHYGLSIADEIGVFKDSNDEFRGRFAVHLDAFFWVKRDSYLPQGSQGLKAVTKAKLNYDPVELDPEEILPFATTKPHVLASYSVSDAVATYYLYMKYVHLFIFSLCTIIPLPPSDVLRKGSGTLCEALLQVQAFIGNIVAPNKELQNHAKFFEGHLLESETYIGGHVEACESGVYREDFAYRFKLVPAALQGLIDSVDHTLEFAIAEEAKMPLDQITNLAEVKQAIVTKLAALRDQPNIETTPLIYHLDVAAMYPNIILTNRLQPMAIVDSATCASCDFNRPESNCQRAMKWSWKGKFFPATRTEYEAIKTQLEWEAIKETDADVKEIKSSRRPTSFSDLPADAQAARIQKRIKDYSHKVYKKYHQERIEEKEAVVCQRENPFYVDTVRAFRDRRYDYKALTSKWKKEAAKKGLSAVEQVKAKDMVLYFDSLQLAHKCILNSFYGYVMRKGARWHSIEMAGVVTQTGANIIKEATKLVEQIGRPLELDTDGIWCMLPAAFPENFEIKTSNPAKPSFTISYPCSMLNVIVHENYTNPHYQTLVDEKTRAYESKAECTIYFEIDGPYRAMVLPAAQAEGKSIKKRYAVFNKDGTLAELKGFELKRRGELKLIKIFQSQVFSEFLKGGSLQECYNAVAAVANRWLDVLHNEGQDLEDEDVFELISENKSMSQALQEYGAAKSVSITCATRLGEFLGNEMVKDKGLNCRFVIARKPDGAPVSQRAIPCAIFQAEDAIKKHYIRRWLKDPAHGDFDIRRLVDWSYYIGRLNSAIQKIITIPAAMQRIRNPCPRVQHPDWLFKRLKERDDTYRQMGIQGYLSKGKAADAAQNIDIEDIGTRAAAALMSSPLRGKNVMAVVRKRTPTATPTKKTAVTLAISDSESDGEGMAREGMDMDGPDKENAGSAGDTDSAESKSRTAAAAATAAAADSKAMVPTAKKRIHPESAGHVELPDRAPDLEQDTAGWVEYQKTRWRQLRERRRAQRQLQGNRGAASGSAVAQRASLTHGLSSWLRAQQRITQQRFWQIVQLTEETPGVFRVWAFTDDRTLRSIRVKVPRVLYINSRDSTLPWLQQGRRVDKHLPRGKTPIHLYELEVDEAKLQARSARLMRLVTDHAIEGVYESKVALDFKTIVQVGCVCKINSAYVDPRTGDYTVKALEFRTTAECPYLEHTVFRRVYIYHSFSDVRGVVGVFWESTATGNSDKKVQFEAQIYLVQPRGQLQPINPKRIFAQAVEGMVASGSLDLSLLRHLTGDEDEDADQDRENIAIPGFSARIAQVSSMTKAYDGLRSRLLEIQAASRKPIIVLAQWASGVSTLYRHLPLLKAEFPVVSIPSSEADNAYPLLQWHSDATLRMMTQFLASFGWWVDNVNFCQFAHIPIGNLEADTFAFCADVHYARLLTQNNHLLWASPTHRADLGGLEDDDNAFSDEYGNPEIAQAGCYRSVSVSFSLRNLAVNTILQSDVLAELEGAIKPPTDKAAKDDSAAPTVAGMVDTEACQDAFKVLKNLATGWVREMTMSMGTQTVPYGQLLLSHLYRWLRSPSSVLYDPALHRMVHKMMKKVFMQLVSRFRKLGATVVYASLRELVLCTNKPTVQRAEAYCKYLLDTVQGRALFKWIDLEPVKAWQCLIFLNNRDYGGIAAPEDASEHAVGYGALESNWNLSEYLTNLGKNYFVATVSDFLLAPLRHQHERSGSAADSARLDNEAAEQKAPSDETITDADGEKWMKAREMDSELQSSDDVIQSIIAFTKRYVEGPLKRRLFDYVHDIKDHERSDTISVGADAKQSTAFPLLPGSHLPLNHPALEFVKAVCHVLSLDQAVDSEVSLLRANLLKLINVRPFSEQAKFVHPCLTFVLPDVICESCNVCRDMDLCRDPDLITGEWNCLTCGHPYNKASIENLLVEIVQRRGVSYQVQDLVCKLCRRVKVSNMSEYCACSGVFECTEPASKFEHSLRPFRNVASFYDFKWLGTVMHALSPVPRIANG